MCARTLIVAVVLLTSTQGWAEGSARVPTTQPGPASAPTEASGESLERRAFRATVEWEHAGVVQAAADEWGVDAFILLALLWAESRLDVTAVNRRSRAAGVSQFTATGRRGLERIRRLRGEHAPFTRADALDPHKAIPAAAEMLAWLTSRWGEQGGVRWYNGGKHRRAFARKVFRKLEQLRREAGLPPQREDEMKKKRQPQPGMTRQGVPDLSRLAGPPPNPGPKLREEFEATCHKCGHDFEFCDCWKPGAAGGARPAAAGGG